MISDDFSKPAGGPNGKDAAGGHEDLSVQSVGTSFRILDELSAAGRPLRLTEIANAMHETKAKIHRHLTTLRQLGVIEQDGGTERYRLGWKLVQLGESVAEQFNLREIAAPYLTAIRDETRETALLAVPIGWETQVVSVAENIYARVYVSIRPGNRPVPHAAAQGRVVLAFSSPDLVDRALARDLVRLTPKTIVDRDELRARFELIRERLWDTAESEIIDGVNTLSVPILRDGDQLAGVFSIVGLSSSIPAEPDPRHLAILHRHARTMSESLKGTVYDHLPPDTSPDLARRRGRPRSTI
ncbi:IclR family transcriptional regulator [Siculibacillus lacustris]|uniref:IclR family transcriptional regulator n=1 Tax=Siculibacillus lacustris TaxID=1549641 RepID=A0A4V6MZ22_9HYPH|nr:IclR family transcriptional regulator [Siculibacillus lacustris]TBW37174.1 IclR family transcriptional regulator [Siculibacillus lacustris]